MDDYGENAYLDSNFVTGPDKCRTFADGTKQSPSFFCWLFVALLAISLIGQTISCAQAISGHPDRRLRNVLASLVVLSVQIFAIYIMYSHCTRCNAWIGFLIVLVLLVLSASVSSAISEDIMPKVPPPPSS